MTGTITLEAVYRLALLACALHGALLCHLVGDFVLQSQVLSDRKRTSWRWAITHAVEYGLLFAVLLWFLPAPWWRLAIVHLVIVATHAVIDRLGLAARWCRFYGVGHPGLWFAAQLVVHRRELRRWRRGDGGLVRPSRPAQPSTPDPAIRIMLSIVVDNTAHLAINAAAITWAVIGG